MRAAECRRALFCPRSQAVDALAGAEFPGSRKLSPITALYSSPYRLALAKPDWSCRAERCRSRANPPAARCGWHWT